MFPDDDGKDNKVTSSMRPCQSMAVEITGAINNHQLG